MSRLSFAEGSSSVDVDAGVKDNVAAGLVLRVQLQQEVVQLVPQACRNGQGGVALGREQVEHRRLVLGAHDGEGGGILQHQPGHRQGVQGVTLPGLPGALARFRRPAGAHLGDGLAGGDQVLGQPAPVAPRPLDPPPLR